MHPGVFTLGTDQPAPGSGQPALGIDERALGSVECVLEAVRRRWRGGKPWENDASP